MTRNAEDGELVLVELRGRLAVRRHGAACSFNDAEHRGWNDGADDVRKGVIVST